MATYIVECYETLVYEVEVEADTPEKAMERVMNMDEPIELPYPVDAFDFKVHCVALKD